MQSANPKRLCFRFSLRTLFVVVTIVAVFFWLGWEFRFVRQRAAMLEKLKLDGGTVNLLSNLNSQQRANRARYQRIPEIPFWRRWLGDQTVIGLALPPEYSPEEANAVLYNFPEAQQMGAVTPTP